MAMVEVGMLILLTQDMDVAITKTARLHANMVYLLRQRLMHVPTSDLLSS